MQLKGSCFCGKSSYSIDGEPLQTALCHCLNCRKLTSSTNTTALLMPTQALTFTPSSPLKTVTITHHAGGFPMTVTFCSECGSALSKDAGAEAFKGLVIVLAGCLDGEGVLEGLNVQAEMWTKYKVGWLGEVSGAKQVGGFL